MYYLCVYVCGVCMTYVWVPRRCVACVGAVCICMAGVCSSLCFTMCMCVVCVYTSVYVPRMCVACLCANVNVRGMCVWLLCVSRVFVCGLCVSRVYLHAIWKCVHLCVVLFRCV